MPFVGCKKIDALTQFDIDYDLQVFFPSNSLINSPFNISTPPQETNFGGEFESNDANKDKIEEVKLKKMYLQTVSPEGKRFTFLDEVEIFVKADGLSEMLLASKYDISDNIGDYLELNPTENDLSEYIKKDKLSFRVRVVQDEQTFQDVEADCKMTFFVDAKVLGV